MRKLKDLSKEELRELYRKNGAFQSYAYDQSYERMMFEQEEEARALNTKVFDWHSHYTSFYLSTPVCYGAKEPERVAHNLDPVYMTIENREFYEELNKLTDEWENMTYDEQEEHEEIYDRMIEVCDKLAEGLTDQLRQYERLEEDFVLEELEDDVAMGYYDNFSVDEEGKIYEETTKIYK